MSPYDTYTSPLAARNASEAMLRLWSPRHKFNTWRRIWLAVAEAQHEITKDQHPHKHPNKQPDRQGGLSSPSHQESPPSRSGCMPGPLVTKEQVEELRAVVTRPGGITDEEMKAAEKYERDLRHDVMAHVHALGDSCPKAKGIIHLGMTSQDVVCNADLDTLWQAFNLIDTKIARAVSSLATSAAQWKSFPTLGFTHYQPAQPVTVGRRCAMWACELDLARRAVDARAGSLNFKRRGLRGATGTQASYLELMGRNSDFVDRLEAGMLYELDEKGYDLSPWMSDEEINSQRLQTADFLERRAKYVGAVHAALSEADRASLAELAECASMNSGAFADGMLEDAARVRAMNATEYRNMKARDYLSRVFPVMGQTYPRVIDTFILADLASTAAVLHKIATDIRLLCNRKELDEPFETKQIGSSAMPYKRNPMRCERICGLTRFVMNLVGNAYDTAATQWLERTLDDSSNRRLSLPEAFLALDGALDLMHNVASGLIVHEAMVRKNLMAELPFMATENILMACVKLGGDRQHYHELIRVHAQAAGMRVKQEGLDNDLLERLRSDKAFWGKARGGPLAAELDWDSLMDPMKYIGRSVEQTERFIKDVVEPLREQYKDQLAALDESGPRV